MRIFRLFPLFLLCVAAVAQSPMDPAGGTLPSKPTPSKTVSGKPVPAKVDQALRERVTGFYASQHDGKFRAAEKFIAEDSLDAYFEGRKVRNEGADILGITFSDDLKKADVVAAVKVRMPNPQFANFLVSPPVHTTWKIDNGRWSWYVRPEQPYATPFGQFPNKPAPAGATEPPKPGKIDVATVQRGISADKNRVTLSKSHPEDEIVLTNSLLGGVSLELEIIPLPGFEAKLESTILKSGGTTKLHLVRKPNMPEDRGGLSVEINVIPTNQVIPIQIDFTEPKQAAKE